MAIYIGMIVIIIGLGNVNIFFESNYLMRRICYLILFAIFVFIFGMRSPLVGVDTMNYVYGFNYIGSLDLAYIIKYEELFEKGYLLYSKLINSIFKSYTLLFIINAFIIYYGIFKFVIHQSLMPMFSLFLYLTMNFYGLSMNITRQFIAMGIFLIAYTFLEEKKYWTYFLLLLLAFSFHQAVIVMGLLPIIYLFKPNLKSLITILSGISLVMLLVYINPALISHLFERYTTYIEVTSVGYGLSAFLWLFYIFFCLAGTYLLINKQFNLDNNSERKIFNAIIMVFASVFFSILTSRVPILNRMEYYFSIFIIILIPNVVYFLFKEKKLATVLFGMIALLIFSYYLSINANNIIPYKFFWEY